MDIETSVAIGGAVVALACGLASAVWDEARWHRQRMQLRKVEPVRVVPPAR